MTRHRGELRRVLSIRPTSMGFGFAVLEGPESLIDCGVKQAPKYDKTWCLAQAAAFMDQYHLDLVVIEDGASKARRRSSRVGDLVAAIRKLARRRKLPTRTLSRRKVKRAFESTERPTKHRIAVRIAVCFPVLAPRVPPPRKPWMSEHYNMAIFDAIAVGLTLRRKAREPLVED